LERQVFLTVNESQAGSRLDKFILKNISDPFPRTRLQEWIRQGRVHVNLKPCLKPGHRLTSGQKVQLRIPAQHSEDPEPIAGKTAAVYADSHVLVINKQPGITVHPAPSETGPTLVHYLLHEYTELRLFQEKQRPGIVHRLDKDTSGLMVVALTREALKDLCRQFALRQVDKKYLALVQGCVSRDQGSIDIPLGRDRQNKTRMAAVPEGRKALTSFKVLDRDPHGLWTLLEVSIYTGRTHQIRVHLAHAGHPIIGDAVYRGRNWNYFEWKGKILSRLARRQLLHSMYLSFVHPQSRARLEFNQPGPGDLVRSLLWLGRSCQKVVITGSPGSGKSTVLKCFEAAGYPVFSADKCVSSLYKPGNDGWLMLRRRFGTRFIPDEDQAVDKQLLLEAMTKDSSIRAEVVHLIHPLVGRALEEFWDEHQNRRLALAEVPLWFESGLKDEQSITVGVFCPDFLRRERTAGHRNWEEHVFSRLDKMQLSQKEKLRRCALVLDNSQGLSAFESRVAGLDRALRQLRRNKQRRLWKHINKMISRP